MATNNSYAVPYRRKREGKTDYKKRMKLLLGHQLRLVIRRSNKHITMQIIEFKTTGDIVRASAHSLELSKYGWNIATCNTSAAYLTGYLLAKKLPGATCVTDLGQHTSVKGAILYAAVKGAIDGGLTIPYSENVIPNINRIRGEHVASYAKQLKTDKEHYQRQFNNYLKNGIDPEKVPALFDTVKAKIGAK